MSTSLDNEKNKIFINNMVESSIRIGLLFLLLFWTYDIIKPFIIPVIWGAIIAVGLMPLTRKLESWMKGKRGLSATILVILMISLIVLPVILLSMSVYEVLTQLLDNIHQGTFAIPGPPEQLATVPVIGEKVYGIWYLFSSNLEKAVIEFMPQIKTAASTTASMLGNGLATAVMSFISLIIAAVFMTHAESASEMVSKVSVRLVGQYGADWAELIAATVRSVLLGVVGVAFIQSMLIGTAFFVLGIPAAGLLTLLVLFLAIAQFPVFVIVIPAIFYAFSNFDTTPAVLFTIWALVAGLSDNILKPILMGRGISIPTAVILIGAIGGMLAAGIIGLFLGAVVLAIWYQLFTTWLKVEENQSPLDYKNSAEKN